MASPAEARGARRPAVLAERPLSRLDRVRLALEIVLAYLLAWRALRRAPIASVLATLRAPESHGGAGDPGATPGEPADVVLARARRLGRAVSRTLSPLPGDTRCLIRSLVLVRLLARRGVPAKLVIGARTVPEFLAHAWVEYAGDPVLSPGDGSFGRLVEL